MGCLHGFLGVDCNYYGKKETDPFGTDYEYKPANGGDEDPTDDDPANGAPDVIAWKKEINEKLPELMQLKNERFETELEIKKMTVYLSAHNNRNWYSKKKIRLLGRKLKTELNIQIDKKDIEIAELIIKLQGKLPPESFDKWET